MATLQHSDSSESLSSGTESDQRITSDSTENSLSKQSETTHSTHRQIPSGKKLWKPGISGNPVGRPKGTKNQITVLKEALELKLRNKAAYKIEKVLDKAIEMALEGDRIMIKLLLEMHMAKPAHTEDSTGGKSQVAVVIQNLTDKGSATAETFPQGTTVIDVTPQKVS